MPRSRLLITVAVVAIAVGIGGFIVYDQVLRGDSAAALSLPKASIGTGSTSSTAPAATAATAASADPVASAAPAAGAADNVAGTWNVAADSVAGYRVREQLASGSITIETTGTTTTLTAGALTVDTTTIASDKPMRDNRLRNEGLQTNSYPTATFTLTKQVEVPAAALTGTASDITLTGDLILHGVTKSVEIPAQAQLVNGTVQVAGSINFPLSDYSIVAPNVGAIIVSIADNGTLEFLVNFTKA